MSKVPCCRTIKKSPSEENIVVRGSMSLSAVETKIPMLVMVTGLPALPILSPATQSTFLHYQMGFIVVDAESNGVLRSSYPALYRSCRYHFHVAQTQNGTLPAIVYTTISADFRATEQRMPFLTTFGVEPIGCLLRRADAYGKGTGDCF